jgi:hypothetical protein
MSVWKGIAGGLAGALLAPLLWLPVLAAPVMWRVSSARAAGTGGSASIMMDSSHLLLAALAGFAAGVWWARRRRSVSKTLVTGRSER